MGPYQRAQRSQAGQDRCHQLYILLVPQGLTDFCTFLSLSFPWWNWEMVNICCQVSFDFAGFEERKTKKPPHFLSNACTGSIFEFGYLLLDDGGRKIIFSSRLPLFFKMYLLLQIYPTPLFSLSPNSLRMLPSAFHCFVDLGPPSVAPMLLSDSACDKNGIWWWGQPSKSLAVVCYSWVMVQRNW